MNISRRGFLGAGAVAASTAGRFFAADNSPRPKIGVTDWNLRRPAIRMRCNRDNGRRSSNAHRNQVCGLAVEGDLNGDLPPAHKRARQWPDIDEIFALVRSCGGESIHWNVYASYSRSGLARRAEAGSIERQIDLIASRT